MIQKARCSAAIRSVQRRSFRHITGGTARTREPTLKQYRTLPKNRHVEAKDLFSRLSTQKLVKLHHEGALPEFLKLDEVAAHLREDDTELLKRWARRGAFPPLISKPNRQYLIETKLYVEWLATRKFGHEPSSELRADFLRNGLRATEPKPPS